MAICAFLIYSTPLRDKLVGGGVLLAGVLLYAFFSPKVHMDHIGDLLATEGAMLRHSLQREERFLGGLLNQLRRVVGMAFRP